MRVRVTIHHPDRISMLRDICDEVDRMAQAPRPYRVALTSGDLSPFTTSPAHGSVPSAS
jgi:hypothetical protein